MRAWSGTGNPDLDGPRAVVTGAGSGYGTALLPAAHGASVVIAARASAALAGVPSPIQRSEPLTDKNHPDTERR